MPTFIEEKHPSFNSLDVGILFSSYQIAALVTGPLAGNYIGKIGRKNCLVFAVFDMTIATVMFGVAGFVEGDTAFYALSMVARLLQGVGASIFLVTSPSIIAIEYPEMQAKYQGILEMCVGLGLMLGPLLATIVVRFLDYSYTLIFFAGLIGIVGIPMAFCLPARLNKVIKDEEGEQQINIPWSLLLSELRTVMVALTSIVAAVTLLFFDPILTPRLAEFGMTDDNFGYVLGGIAFSYVVGAITISFAFSGRLDARWIITICFVLVTLGIFFTSAFLTDSLTETVCGLCLVGFASAGIFIPTIPESMNVM